jgi:hypothetical protein
MRGAVGAVIAVTAVAACGARGSCPRFATADAGQDGTCSCPDDAVVLLGACVSPKTADAYCGTGARFAAGACVFRSCPDAQSLDAKTGECVPPRALREIAAGQQISFAVGERLACDDGRPPVVDGDDIACVPSEALCPRGSRPARGACVASTRCRPAEIATPDGARCATLLTRSASGYVVDVAAWARAVFGPNGGAGSADLCAPLALHARAFGATTHAAEQIVPIRIELRFPNNDVADVRAIIASPALASAPRAATVLDESTRPLVRALQALGGEASTGAVDLTVRCVVRAGERPHAVAP